MVGRSQWIGDIGYGDGLLSPNGGAKPHKRFRLVRLSGGDFLLLVQKEAKHARGHPETSTHRNARSESQRAASRSVG